MKAANWYYTPGNLPDEAPQWLRRELQALSEASRGVAPFVQLQPAYVAPTKPRQGLMAYADGTSWNPGSGEGLYLYKSTGWKYLG